MSSVTTSIRLEQQLARRLARAAARLSRGKSWIVSKALEDYLAKTNQEELKAEARRQSELVSRAERRGKGIGFPEEDVEDWR
jgi:predicted transcriptional regulator